MEIINRQTKVNVEALKSQLLQRKTTKERFKFPCSQEQAVDILTAAYMAEVEFRHRRFKDDEMTKKNISALASFLTSDKSKFGALMCGKCGNGKTTLLYAFQSALNYLASRGFYERGVGIKIVDAKEVVFFATEASQSSKLKRHEMLAIEDLGKEAKEVYEYGNVLNPVVDLLEYRYNEQLFTLITTNLTPKQIREKYGVRIADRFNEMFDVIIFEQETYRV